MSEFSNPLATNSSMKDNLAEKSTSRAQGEGNQPEIADMGSCECMCLPHGQNGRNLVICIDGTANQFSEKNTNVIELYSRLVKDDTQMTYYNSGIGTFVKDSHSWAALKQSFKHSIDMAIAINFKSKVLSAYQWLSENYEIGDRIFLFGFSRGAYQVRVIAGMIEKVGLLHKGNNEQIPFAYELYTRTTAGEKRAKASENRATADENQATASENSSIPPIDLFTAGENPSVVRENKTTDPENKAERLCKQFKRTLSRPDVRVHFVGAWDTVSSIGVARGTSLPETNNGMKHVCFFRHALALDELRVKFLPEYVNGGDGPGDDGWNDRVQEVWFAGSHSDIGGGNVINDRLDLFGPSLRWMTYEAIHRGLKMESHRGGWHPVFPTPSMTRVWRTLEYIPIPRLSYRNKDSIVWWPHCEKPRVIRDGQRIHASVFDVMDKSHGTYVPAPGGKILESERDHAVKDPYTDATTVLEALRNYTMEIEISEENLHILQALPSTESGRRSITEFPKAADILLKALQVEFQRTLPRSDVTPDSKLRKSILFPLVEALKAFDSVQYSELSTPRDILTDLWTVLEREYPEHQQTWTRFRHVFGDKLEKTIATSLKMIRLQRHISKLQVMLARIRGAPAPRTWGDQEARASADQDGIDEETSM